MESPSPLSAHGKAVPLPQSTPKRLLAGTAAFSAIQLENLARMVPNPMRQFPANIVLIHAGTYELLMTQPDGVNQGSFAGPVQHLNTILEGFYAINPEGLIVVYWPTFRRSSQPIDQGRHRASGQ